MIGLLLAAAATAAWLLAPGSGISAPSPGRRAVTNPEVQPRQSTAGAAPHRSAVTPTQGSPSPPSSGPRGDPSTDWRVRVLDPNGHAVVAYEARWLRSASLRTPAARAVTRRHEGQRRVLFDRLGTALAPDEAGLLRVPWTRQPSAVGVSIESAFGSLVLSGPPDPSSIRTLRLETVRRSEIVILSADGLPRAGIRIDALWLDGAQSRRTPLGSTDVMGRFALTSDIATLRFIHAQPSRRADIGIGIPGHGPGHPIPAGGAWPQRIELRCARTGTLRVRAASTEHDIDSLGASLRLRHEREPADRWFSFPLNRGEATEIEVAVGGRYYWEVRSTTATPDDHGSLLGPASGGEVTDLVWTPSGLCTFVGSLPAPAAELPSGATATIRLEAPDNPLFPKVRTVRLDERGSFRVTFTTTDIEGAATLTALAGASGGYGPVAIEVQDGVAVLGRLPPMNLVTMATVEVRDSEGSVVETSELRASDSAVVSGRTGRFEILVPGPTGSVEVEAVAPGFEALRARIAPSEDVEVLTLQPARSLSVEAWIEDWLDTDDLRGALVRSGRKEESSWAHVSRLGPERVRFHWHAAPRSSLEISLLSCWPPCELVRLSDISSEAVELPVPDLRGLRESRWTVTNPTGPIHVAQRGAESKLRGDAVVGAPEGGVLLLRQPADLLFARAGSRPIRATPAPGQDLELTFRPAVPLRAAWRDDPSSACDLQLRITRFEPSPGQLAWLRLWRSTFTERVSLLELVGAPEQSAADGFPLLLQGRYALAPVAPGPARAHLDVTLRGHHADPPRLLIQR